MSSPGSGQLPGNGEKVFGNVATGRWSHTHTHVGSTDGFTCYEKERRKM